MVVCRALKKLTPVEERDIIEEKIELLILERDRLAHTGEYDLAHECCRKIKVLKKELIILGLPIRGYY